MKKLILMYLGIVAIREVAKYYKINSFEDVLKMVLPPLEDILPEKTNSSVNSNTHSKTKSRELVNA